MRIIEINKNEFLNLLLNPTPFNEGAYGKITLINDKLYKIYYNDFIITYMTKDKNIIDNDVDIWLTIEKKIGHGLKNPHKMLETYKRLLETKSCNLITGVLSYRDLLVGIEMNYYKDYITLKEAAFTLSKPELNKYLSTCKDLINDLMMHNIIPGDIREENILVNIETKDVILIDLDDKETIYGPDNYINTFPHIVYNIEERFNSMVKRLNDENQKILRKRI